MTKRTEYCRDAKRGDKEAIKEEQVLQKYLVVLKEGKRAATAVLEDEERGAVKSVELRLRSYTIHGLNKKTGGHNLMK